MMSSPFASLSSLLVWAALLGSVPSSLAMDYPTTPMNVLDIQLLGTYKQADPEAAFDESATEILAYDPETYRVMVTNALDETVDVIDMTDPTSPSLVTSLSLDGTPNSVTIYDRLLAVAVENEIKTDNGSVVFYDLDDLSQVGSVEVGPLPDMLTFTPDGKYVVVALEGEPNDDYSIDPNGSVAIINVKSMTVTNVGFEDYNGHEDELREMGIRIFGPGSSASQDFEPEYVAVSADSKYAVVSLQENNAFVIVDIKKGKIKDLVPLGYKDHMKPENMIDASNRDDAINMATYPVHGMYQPDTIKGFKIGKDQYFICANEGDSRDYDGYSEEERFGDFCEDGLLDPDAFPAGPELDELCKDENLGRIKVTSANGQNPANGMYEKVFVYGARSFSIYNDNMEMIFDSGAWLEMITATELGMDGFNANNDENGFDSRSDDKGPEPEGLVVAEMGGCTYAFVLLERVSGFAVFDISNPYAPMFDQFVTNRDYLASDDDLKLGLGGDLGPEDAVFVPMYQSPIDMPLLIVANEVSGTITSYSVMGKTGKKSKGGKKVKDGKKMKDGKKGENGKN